MTTGINKKITPLADPKFGKPIRVLVWINGEFDIEHYIKLELVDLKSWARVLSFLTAALKPHFGAIRKLYHLATRKMVTCLEDILPGERYVAVGVDKFRFKKPGYLTIQEKKKIRSKSKNPFRKHVESILNFMDYTKKKKRTVIYVMVSGRTCQEPLKVVLTRDDFKSYDMILKFLGYQLDVEEGVHYLANVKGRIVFRAVEELRHGNVYVAVPFGGRFVRMNYIQLFGKLRPDKIIIRSRKPNTNHNPLRVGKKKIKTRSKNLLLKGNTDNQIHTTTSESGIAAQAVESVSQLPQRDGAVSKQSIRKYESGSRSSKESHPALQSHNENQTNNAISESGIADQTVESVSKQSIRKHESGSQSSKESHPSLKSDDKNQTNNSTSESGMLCRCYASQTVESVRQLSQRDGDFSKQSIRKHESGSRSSKKSHPSLQSHNENQTNNSTSESGIAGQTVGSVSQLSQRDGTVSKQSIRKHESGSRSSKESHPSLQSHDENQTSNSTSESGIAAQTVGSVSQLSQTDGAVSKQSIRKHESGTQSSQESHPSLKSYDKNQTNNSTSKSGMLCRCYASQTVGSVRQLSQRDGAFSKQSIRKHESGSRSSKKSHPSLQSYNENQTNNSTSESDIAGQTVGSVSQLSQRDGAVSKQSIRKHESGSRSSKKSHPSLQSHKENQTNNSTSESGIAGQTVGSVRQLSQRDGAVSKQSIRKHESGSRSSKKSHPSLQSHKENQTNNSTSESGIAGQTVGSVRQLSQRDGAVSKQSIRKHESDSRSSKKSHPSLQSHKENQTNNSTRESGIAGQTAESVSKLSQTDGPVSKQFPKKDYTDSPSVEKFDHTIKSHSDNHIHNLPGQSGTAGQTVQKSTQLSLSVSVTIIAQLSKDGTVCIQPLRKDETDSRSVENSHTDNYMHNSTSVAVQTLRNLSQLSQNNENDDFVTKPSVRKESNDDQSAKRDSSDNNSLLTVMSNPEFPGIYGSDGPFIQKNSSQQESLEDQTNVLGPFQETEQDGSDKSVSSVVQSLSEETVTWCTTEPIENEKIAPPQEEPSNHSKEKVMTTFAEIAQNKKSEIKDSTSLIAHAIKKENGKTNSRSYKNSRVTRGKYPGN